MRSVLALAVLLALCACGEGHTGGVDGPAQGAGSAWTRFGGSPLSGRDGPMIAYVAGEVVVVGGYAGRPCPPNADCATSQPPQRDGAAYSPTTHTWRAIAAAPVPVPEWTRPAVIGDRLYLGLDRTLLSWDSSKDAWSSLAVPGGASAAGVVADGRRLIVEPGDEARRARPALVLDTRTRTWSTLPADPLTPSFDRMITATPAGLVLTARGMDAHGNPDDPALLRAAVLAPGATTWKELPQGHQLGGGAWTWTGTRMVDATLGGADGGEIDNYGLTLPYGGRLDPVTGVWSGLPDAPDEGDGGWPVFAPDGPMIASGGWLYDDSDGRWTRLERPDRAPEEPGPAVWAGDDLVVYGGGTWHGEKYERTTDIWLLRGH